MTRTLIRGILREFHYDNRKTLGDMMQFCFYSKSIWTLLSMGCILALIGGCSGGNPNLTAVSGIVKADGEPVSEGEIMFYPTSGRPAVGQIGPDGRYQLTSFKKGDGVPPGSHKVTITVLKVTNTSNAPAPASVDEETGDFMAKMRSVWLIPKKYAELRTTTLTAEVEKGKPNEINFDSADFD